MFGLNFSKPGPGIRKDAPKKTGFPLFIETLSREFWSLIALNFIFIISCIPIITIGPAICALNYVCGKMVRDEPIDTMSDFKKGFKDNIFQGIAVGFVVLFVFVALLYAYFFYRSVLGYVAYVLIALIAIFALFNIYIFPLAVFVQLPVKAIFKNSFLLCLMSPKKSLICFAVSFMLLFVNLLIYPVCIGYYLICGFSLGILINCFFVYPIIKKYVIFDGEEQTEPSEDDSQDGDDSSIVAVIE